MSHERYSRHRLLPQVGDAGQERIGAARVLVVGMGGLGCPVAMTLAAAGVGELRLSDFDRVEPSNLARQWLYTPDDVGKDKAVAAAAALARQNPDVTITALPYALDDEDLAEEVDAADVVLDCCDNAETRFALNAACVAARTPLVSAAAVRGEGHVTVFDPRDESSPCYRCLYSDETDGAEDEPCSLVGVFSPVLGVVANLQAGEALKLLVAGAAEHSTDSLAGRLIVVDAFYADVRTLRLRRAPDCPVCGGRS